jgi:4-carboxymuconolactone decarboxylase
MTQSPRIPPIRGKADMAPEHHAVADRVQAFFGAIGGPFGMMLHSPVLANQVLDVVEDMRIHTTVEAPLRALAIMATVRERRMGYVWAAQVAYARRVGVREQVIDVIRTQGDTTGLPEQEREIIDYARELARDEKVSPARFDALRARYGERWLVELTTSAQFYTFLCGVVNAFEVPIPEGGDHF